MDGHGSHEQTAGGGRCGRPHPGDGPTRRASGDAGVGPRLRAAVADRRPQGLWHSPFDAFWLLDTPRAAPGHRATTEATLEAIARVALRSGSQVVPAPTPRRRHPPRGLRYAAGHRTGPGKIWLDDQHCLHRAPQPRYSSVRIGGWSPGQYALPGRNGLAGSVGLVPGDGPRIDGSRLVVERSVALPGAAVASGADGLKQDAGR